MIYPKKLMTITELLELGFTRHMLMNYSRAKGAPVVRTVGGGKIYFDTDKMDEFIKNVSKRR